MKFYSVHEFCKYLINAIHFQVWICKTHRELLCRLQ